LLKKTILRFSEEQGEHLRTRLTPAEIEELELAGYLLCGRVLTNDELAEARSEVDRALVEYTNDTTRPEKINFVHTYDEYFMRLATHPRLLDIVQSVLGPDLALFSSHLLCKPAGDGHAVTWHQDAAYWPLEPMEVLTVWLALDDSDAENGCLRVIPGSHRDGLVSHRATGAHSLLKKEVPVERADESKAVDVALHAGECSVHRPYLIHGSNPNTSGRRRAGLPLRYIPTTTRVKAVDDRSFNPNYPDIDYGKIVCLVRGRDRAGNRYLNQ
jgi:phytanoyl-CoA hydroxylase